jgi:DNA integrity scanning protein DisA with diadenylate cyclase activity
MTKETLVVQLEAAKSLSSQVDIDKVIELIKQIETPTRITQELADDICSKIERCLDNNCDDLVDKDNVSFSIGYGNTIEIDDAQIDTYEVMRHISDILDDFVNEEDEDENETGHTLPGFENGSGIDQVTIY